MKTLGDLTAQITNQPRTNELVPQSQGQQNALALPISRSPEGQQRLATRLYRDFHALKTYGKEPESLDSIIDLFTEQFADCSFEQVNQAMHAHCGESVEFPTPADIRKHLKARQEREMADNRPERQVFVAPDRIKLTPQEREERAKSLRQLAEQLSPEEKIQRTVAVMRESGAPQADIDAFLLENA